MFDHSSKYNQHTVFLATWQFWIAASSAYIYATGYIKGFAYLSGLQEYLMPTEVYAPGSLFVWGLISVIGVLSPPAVALLGCLALSRAIWPFGYNSLGARIGFSILSAALLYISWRMLFFGSLEFPSLGSLAFFTQVFETRLESWQWFAARDPFNAGLYRVSIIAYLVSFFLLCWLAVIDFGNRRYKRIVIASLVVVGMWGVVNGWCQEMKAGFFLSQEGYAKIVQSPSMYGSLITREKISLFSKPVEGFEKGVFLTSGVLLNRFDKTYYLYQGDFFHSPPHMPSKRGIVVVPESQVISFITGSTQDTVSENLPTNSSK